VDGFV
jgi:hypothetical protein